MESAAWNCASVGKCVCGHFGARLSLFLRGRRGGGGGSGSEEGEGGESSTTVVLVLVVLLNPITAVATASKIPKYNTLHIIS